MQDPSAFQQMKTPFPEQEHLKCPRCDSSNTKFCYYNNYNLSQPRHFCKNCRRYWTKGGTLRNIPVGGGSRKNAKRPSNPKRQNPDPEPARISQSRRTHEPSSPPRSSPQSVSSSTVVTSVSEPDPTRMYTLSEDPERKMMDITGSFSSLLATSTQFGSLLNGLNPNGSAPKMVQLGDFTEDLNVASSGQNPVLDEQGNNGSESYLLQSGESNFWGGGATASGGAGSENGWPDLAIYTPGSGFQ